MDNLKIQCFSLLFLLYINYQPAAINTEYKPIFFDDGTRIIYHPATTDYYQNPIHNVFVDNSLRPVNSY
jgi:hypothetical protein